MSRPVSLTIAVVLQWVAAVGALLAGLDLATSAIALSGEGTKSALEQAMIGQGVSDVSGRQLVIGVFMAGMLVIALALVRVILAVYLGRGRNWARVVITVLVAFNLLSGVAYLFQDEQWRAVPTILLEVVILWLLYNSRSSAFIRERSGS